MLKSALKYWVEEFDIDGFRCDYFEILHIPNRIEYENATYPTGYPMFRYTEKHGEIRAAEMYGNAHAA